MKNTMLHMKLNSAVSVFAVAAAFSVILPPLANPVLAAPFNLNIPVEQRGLLGIELTNDASAARLAGVCFLPDCQDSDTMHGDVNMNVNQDTEWCEKKGYTYYASGQCPQYQAQVGKCSRDDHYLKCNPVKWCTDNGYNTQSCSLPSFVDGQCPNGKPYYKQCKEDRPRACRESGYVNSCSSGRLYATTNRCPYDNSYGKCCTASPSTGCPSSYAVNCDPSRGSSGTDTCGYTCYRCCDDNCPSGTSKNYTGSYASTTECGSRCNRCKDCTSGKTYWNGSYVGSSECGSCYSCSDTCSSGSKSVSCNWDEDNVRVSSTECGTSCYECQYNSDCSVTSKSCNYGCASYNSCDKCTSCNSCSPLSDQTNCTYGTTSCSNGCGGTRTCCKSNPWKGYFEPFKQSTDGCFERSENPGEFMWTVSANIYCINQETGEKNFIFKNMRCNGIGKSYSSLAECQSQEPAASADAGYVGEYYGDCKDANTSPLGSTSADTNKCTR